MSGKSRYFQWHFYPSVLQQFGESNSTYGMVFRIKISSYFHNIYDVAESLNIQFHGWLFIKFGKKYNFPRLVPHLEKFHISPTFTNRGNPLKYTYKYFTSIRKYLMSKPSKFPKSNQESLPFSSNPPSKGTTAPWASGLGSSPTKWPFSTLRSDHIFL